MFLQNHLRRKIASRIEKKSIDSKERREIPTSLLLSSKLIENASELAKKSIVKKLFKKIWEYTKNVDD